MATIVLDTRKYKERLMSEGKLAEETADVVVDLLVDTTSELVTKDELRSELQNQTIKLLLAGVAIAGLAVAMNSYILQALLQ